MIGLSIRFRQFVITALCCGCAADAGVSPVPVRQAAIAFNGFDSSFVWDIYTINPGSSGLRNLTNSPEDDRFPAWSRDYQRIAWFSKGTPWGIYVMSADGTGKRLVAAVDDVERITWSPDGTRLAFQANISSVFGVHVVSVDSGAPKPLSTSPTGRSPSWSPDGKTIAYASGPGYGSLIYLIDATGRNRRVISTTLEERSGDVDPSWSPDGSEIAFARFDSAGMGIGVWIMNADGSNPRQVTSSSDRWPAWSPDGTQLVVQRLNQKGGVSLCIVHVADRSFSHCLMTDTSLAGQPSW